MNTIEQPKARGHGSRRSAGDARGDAADIVLLLVTILTLMGVAAGIAVGFPLALEAFSGHAKAVAVVSPAPLAPPVQPKKEIDEERDGPPIVDDVRSAERMYAAAPITASFDRSAPSATHC